MPTDINPENIVTYTSSDWFYYVEKNKMPDHIEKKVAEAVDYYCRLFGCDEKMAWIHGLFTSTTKTICGTERHPTVQDISEASLAKYVAATIVHRMEKEQRLNDILDFCEVSLHYTAESEHYSLFSKHVFAQIASVIRYNKFTDILDDVEPAGWLGERREKYLKAMPTGSFFELLLNFVFLGVFLYVTNIICTNPTIDHYMVKYPGIGLQPCIFTILFFVYSHLGLKRGIFRSLLSALPWGLYSFAMFLLMLEENLEGAVRLGKLGISCALFTIFIPLWFRTLFNNISCVFFHRLRMVRYEEAIDNMEKYIDFVLPGIRHMVDMYRTDADTKATVDKLCNTSYQSNEKGIVQFKILKMGYKAPKQYLEPAE